MWLAVGDERAQHPMELTHVSEPQQSSRHDDQSDEVKRKDEHRLVDSDHRRQAGAEGRRRKATKERRRILSDEQVANPLIGAVVEAVDEAHAENLDVEHVDYDNPKGGRRTP